ncbi:MAG: penicillin-binding transpeptidase domain-containing protein [Syntrophotalea acetylenica]|jgi:cell division protein FtsI (penicillin-binding protein 3)|uniref:Penicillin-binding protein n=3 Tax=Syntrophotalea acetylenica TaxID=29542 RepID=A0A1L3GHE9_SYNAC|nr:penicillin-binding transpeptidase domain-containing protein [Syntrophotalea acetylenica]APG25356.1 penicillin-binding protein [Syntrophotalea acetylenica]MDD4456707.1 penicillin-binding transpeptidase domain-containing protein [Syntrophotalea acetylenica]MDY0262629.1 penicillin-binding transpeptidase domain-containing protein [Syntrophotalea acetylenica]
MKLTPEKSCKIRIVLMGVGFTLFFLAIVGRGFWLQVIDADATAARARKQYKRIVPLTPKRGGIFDRNGAELARSISIDSVFAEPLRIEDVDGTVRALSRLLGQSSGTLRKKLTSNRSFVWLKRKMQPEQSARIRGLKLPGIAFTKEHQRFYPNGHLAAQLLGFTGLDPRGLEGLERFYDSQLQGQEGFLVAAKDGRRKGMGASDKVIQGGSDGNSLYLTVDRNLQYLAEKELAKALQENKARAGCVVIVDPASGDILAMANQPTYNPNAFGRFPASSRRNRAVCDEFEPGSTLKVFLVAAALNENLVRPEQLINCENGAYRVGGMTIHDHHPHDILSVADVLRLSSNIGSAKIGKILERRRYFDYLRKFGFGDRTGIDFPGEATGQLRKPELWFEGDLAAVSFGQGMTVTALQLARATAAIANGGLLMHSGLVRQIVNDHGEVVQRNEPRVLRRVVSEQVAGRIRGLMELVTRDGGTGTLASVPGYRVAGKTGTAQKVDPVTGGYSADKRVASFVGFAPVENPRLVIMVMVDEPRSQVYGGLVAAPVFSRIAGQALRYLGVPPSEAEMDPPLPPETMETREAITTGEVQTLQVSEKGLPVMPQCFGMSCRQVLQFMDRLGLNIRIRGSGRVVDQFPNPGETIRYGDEVWVKLEPPA